MTDNILSITSATVPAESEAAVVDAYRKATAVLPHMVLKTFLVKGDANEWQIVTLWRSRAQLEEYRRSVQTPAAVQIFMDVDAKPAVAVFDVVHQAATS